MDAEQREYLRSLLLREQLMVQKSKGVGVTLYGEWREQIYHKADLIERTLRDLED